MSNTERDLGATPKRTKQMHSHRSTLSQDFDRGYLNLLSPAIQARLMVRDKKVKKVGANEPD